MKVESTTANLAAQLAAKVQAPSTAPPERASIPAVNGPARIQEPPSAGIREQSAANPVETRAVNQPSGARFRVDEATKRIISQVLDENREVIKQIPPDEVLKISANFRKFTALLFDEQA